MKKILPILLSLFMIGCPSSNSNNIKDAAPDVQQDIQLDNIANKIDTEDYSISVPDGWQVMNPAKVGAILLLVNVKTEQMILLTKEEYQFTYDTYLIQNIRSLKQDGIKVLSTKEIEKDNMQFALIKTSQDDINVWFWLTVKNRNGFVFYCGGSNKISFNECEAIFNSLVLR